MKFDVLKRLDANAIEDGTWMDLIDPIDGEKMFRDPETKLKPCRAQVRSSSSDAVRQSDLKQSQLTQAKLRRAKPAVRDMIAQTAGEDAIRRRFSRELVALENCIGDTAGAVPLTEAEADEIYADKTMRWLVNQVLEYADEESNYPVRPTGDAAPGARPSKSSSKS